MLLQAQELFAPSISHNLDAKPSQCSRNPETVGGKLARFEKSVVHGLYLMRIYVQTLVRGLPLEKRLSLEKRMILSEAFR